MPPGNMDLMLVEPDATGHRVVLYIRAIVREAMARGWRVRVLTTESARSHSAYRTVTEEHPGGMETLEMPDVEHPSGQPGAVALTRYQWSLFNAVAEGYASARQATGAPEVVYLNSLDPVEKAVSVRGSPFGRDAFAGLLMMPRFHHRGEGLATPRRFLDPLHGLLLRRILRIPTLRALTTIDPTLAAAARRRAWRCHEKVRWVPDPGSLRAPGRRAEARGGLCIPDGAFVVLLYGGITGRKGLGRLLEALADPRVPTHVTALVAGHVHEDAAHMLAGGVAGRLREAGRLFELTGFLDDPHEARVFAASDAVWLGYEGFYGASGVLVQAGAAGLPVVATSNGIIGWLVRRHGLGALMGDGAGGAAEALCRLVADRDLRAASAANGRAFASERTPERFGSAVCNALAGLDPEGTSR